ncbi:MAG: NAD-dependent epimerase/dehydratase family protein [Phycisphaerae bacterium]|nr:NAD-dependent epimerase/dehydratase family protein [Phycisphaerae bacterium]
MTDQRQGLNLSNQTALVTGGGGFLGKAIVLQLLSAGCRVRCFSRNAYPELTALGVEPVRGDLMDRAAVAKAAAGCDVVFHVAAKAGIWGSYDSYYRPNVIGTQHVIDACRQQRVRRLVHTSSPSVVFDGHDMEGVSESVPYASHFHAPYPATKAAAEQAVLAANGPELATTALRPHLIWGPGDNHLVPRIISRAKRLRRIGRTNKLVDSVYIDNAAEAHVLAAARLDIGSRVAGRAYFISNGEPRPIWDLVGCILAAAGLPPVTKSVPLGVARAASMLIELTYRFFRAEREPPLTRFLVSELSTAHWFDIIAARRDLDYQPRVSIAEGLDRLRDWLSSREGR